MKPEIEAAVAKLKTCHKDAKDQDTGVEEYRRMLESQSSVLDRFQPMLAPENLPNLTEAEFREFLPFSNNRHWMTLQRHGPAICADMPKLRQALEILFDESRTIVDRLDTLVSSTGKNYVPRLGRAVLTPLLLVRYPDRYGVWNNVAEAGMKALKIWPDFEPKASFGEKYKQLNEMMAEIASSVGVDLWALDGLWWAYQRLRDRNGDEGTDITTPIDDDVEPAARFGLERHLHDFLRDNWLHTELGKEWTIFEENGDPDAGYEYPTDIGQIDLLAIHRDGSRWLVIELKRNQSSDQTIGQVLRYMGWVEENLAGQGETVHGLIIAHAADKKIRYALKNVNNVEVKLYEVSFQLKDMDD